MRDTLGAADVGRRVVDDQVVGIDRLADGAIAERAEVDLLEGDAAEAQQEQHAVGVGIVLGRHRREVVVHVPLQGFRHLVGLVARGVAVDADLDGTVGRQELAARVRLEAQHGFQQQRMSNAVHALDGCAFGGATDAWHLKLQAQELDALRAVLDPILAAVDVVADAAHEIFGNARELQVIDLVHQVVEPADRRLGLAALDRLAVEADGDRSVGVIDLDDVALVIELRDIDAFGGLLDNDVLGVEAAVLFRLDKSNVGRKPRRQWHPSRPSGCGIVAR